MPVGKGQKNKTLSCVADILERFNDVAEEACHVAWEAGYDAGNVNANTHDVDPTITTVEDSKTVS